ncbi:MAG: SusC/RagA family TonB-linked outer membrane protein, partial [Bacteroidota bacterium]
MNSHFLRLCFLFAIHALLGSAVFGQVAIKGMVKNAEDGTALTGARVIVLGQNIGVFADDNGAFSLTVPSVNAKLEVSYFGFASQSISLDGQTDLTIELKPDFSSLDEVVVVGYGTKKKVDITGSISPITSDDFEAQPLTRVSDALQGRAAGVQVNSTDGSPGNNARIRIRGTNSITGPGGPLVVVDGVIWDVGANLGSINPSDIQAIQVLKDASSTALYGSRGANGVILVTTKSGKRGKPQVNFDAFWGLQSLPRKIDVVNGGEYARLINEQLAVGGGAPAFDETALAALDSSGGTDWQDEIYRRGTDALQQNYALSISGKKDGLSYFISGNRVSHEGILINNNYERLGLRSNLNLEISPKFSIGLNVSLSREKALNGFISNLLFAPNASALVFDPTSPVYDGDSIPVRFSRYGSIGVSPVAAALGRQDDRNTFTQMGTFFLNYELVQGLTYSLTAGLRSQNYTGTNYVAVYATNQNSDVANVFNNDRLQLQHTHMLQYQNTFADLHDLTVKGVFEEQTVQNFGSSSNGTALLIPGVEVNNLAFANTQLISSYQNAEAIRSYVGRVEYGYANKYLLTGTVRVDGSSKFAPKNRYGVFPSVAAAWRISNESFMDGLPALSNLKLRASYGQIGNQAIAPYSTFGLLSSGLQFNAVLDNAAAIIGIAPGRFPNPDLRWETTTQLDVGL